MQFSTENVSKSILLQSQNTFPMDILFMYCMHHLKNHNCIFPTGIYEMFCREMFGKKPKTLTFGLQPHKIPDCDVVRTVGYWGLYCNYFKA